MVIMIASHLSVNSYSAKKGSHMKKQDLKKKIKQEIETEATILERRVNTKKELASHEMPEDSYEQLMGQIQAKKISKARHRFSSRKALATVAMVAVLIMVAGVGVNGARLYVLSVENREKDGDLNISASTDDIFYVDLTEEEAYEKIEENIGILALRIGNKPQGMELEKVYIDTKMGEAIMEFHYASHILKIYENKQNKEASFNLQLDGEVVDLIETFYLENTVDIIEVDKGNHETFYTVQIEYGNAYYYITSDIDLETFKTILYGIIFKSI